MTKERRRFQETEGPTTIDLILINTEQNRCLLRTMALAIKCDLTFKPGLGSKCDD